MSPESGVPIPTCGRIVHYQTLGVTLPAIVVAAEGLVIDLVVFDSRANKGATPCFSANDVPWNNVPTEGHWRWPDRA